MKQGRSEMDEIKQLFNGPGSIRSFLKEGVSVALFCVCCYGGYVFAWAVL